MTDAYAAFLAAKQIAAPSHTIAHTRPLHDALFPFQRDIVAWALRKGRAAIFADCGLGKTLMQLEWAQHVHESTGKPVLILAPLAVSAQTVAEGARFGYTVTACRHQADMRDGLNITNYEMLEHFDTAPLAGIVLDESSILKAYDGKTRTAIIEAFGATPYRIACTATPAPNDFMELGNHADFLGVLTRAEMLATFFVHDGGDTSSWRLKGHAEDAFWRWLCTWAVTLRKPSDLGYSDDGFTLPPLRMHHHVLGVDPARAVDRGRLFLTEARTLEERRTERKLSIGERVQAAADLINATPGAWIVWCDFNAEADACEKAIRDAVQVSGADSPEDKIDRLTGFAEGRYRILVTKPSIASFGMNWQHCHQSAFVGLSDSYERFYQAVRRNWRFGQQSPVDCHIFTSETEGAVLANIERKEAAAAQMQDGMVHHMAALSVGELHTETQRGGVEYVTTQREGDGWTMHQGDCIEGVRALPENSVHYSIFSPPFASLYTYSASERDMGNARDHAEFFQHFRFLVGDLLRVTMPGRLLSFHCMNLPTSKMRDNVIGLTDFRGALIKEFTDAGWIFHSEVCIWKDPVTSMQRTKALGLLHKQIVKDSCMSRQGIPDYLVTMRKPGENPERVSGPLTYYRGDDAHLTRIYGEDTGGDTRASINIWQRYASPVWMDIDPSRTLQRTSAREEKDERHICPLQLDVIERALQLWTNPGDLVLSPFGGIGSEGYCAVQMGRRFLGYELKRSYFEQACANLAAAARQGHSQRGLFDAPDTDAAEVADAV